MPVCCCILGSFPIGYYEISKMKITIDLGSGLITKAKKMASAEGITFSLFVEHALKANLQVNRSNKESFALADGSFRGELGFCLGIDPKDWSTILSLAYQHDGS